MDVALFSPLKYTFLAIFMLQQHKFVSIKEKSKLILAIATNNYELFVL